MRTDVSGGVGWAVCLLAAGTLTACGGDPSGPGGGSGRSEDRQAEHRPTVGVAPAADRVAYYQLATAAGFLGASAAATQVGSPDPARAQLAAADQRLAQLRPADQGLARAVVELRTAIARWTHRSGGRPLQLAAHVLVTVRTTGAVLQGFLRRHRALAGSIPG